MALFTKKSVAELEAAAGKDTLKKALGPLNLTALGIGSIIGTGIFVLTGTAASQHAGPALVLSMVSAAIACAFAGLCYAEMASMIPVAGSAYTYAYASIGELVAWIIGWDLILEYALSVSTIAVGWSGYFASFLKGIGISIPAQFLGAPGVATMAGGPVGVFNLPAFLVVLLVTWLLVVGIKESASTNTVLVIIKSITLVVFVIAGYSYINRANWTPFIPPNTGEFGSFGWSGILRGAGIIFFAFIGFDAVSTASQEAKNPQRDLPIAILGSLAICTVLYIGVALVLTGIVSYHELNVPDPLARGIDATGLTWLSPFIKISAVFGLFSTMLVQLLGQSRIFFSMSRDGLLPALFGRVHAKFKTPHIATILTGVVTATAAGLVPLSTLSELVSMGTLLAFVLACLGIIILRKTSPEVPRPFKTPWVPVVPIIGAVSCFAQMLGLPLATWIRLVVWLLIGFVIYFAFGRQRAEAMRVAAAIR